MCTALPGPSGVSAALSIAWGVPEAPQDLQPGPPHAQQHKAARGGLLRCSWHGSAWASSSPAPSGGWHELAVSSKQPGQGLPAWQGDGIEQQRCQQVTSVPGRPRARSMQCASVAMAGVRHLPSMQGRALGKTSSAMGMGGSGHAAGTSPLSLSPFPTQ